ncbi:unnamed protein product [Urochloa humidicola]
MLLLPSLLLLVLSCWCCVATAAQPALASSPSPDSSFPAPASFVRMWCAGMEYPTLCNATLSLYASAVGASSACLSWAALNVMRGGTRTVTRAMKAMSGGHHLAPAGAKVAQDCVSMLHDTEDLLYQAAEAMERLGKRSQAERGRRRATQGREVRGG